MNVKKQKQWQQEGRRKRRKYKAKSQHEQFYIYDLLVMQINEANVIKRLYDKLKDSFPMCSWTSWWQARNQVDCREPILF